MLKQLITLTLVMFLACGCTQKQKPEEISFASWGSVTEVNILKKIISDYEAENPSTKINFIHIPQNYFQKLHLLFATKTAPDIVFMNNLYLPVYESHLENLDNLIDTKDFYPQCLSGLSYDNKLLAVPRDISNLVLYVNTDIINRPKSTWTLEDLLKIAKENSKNNVWGIGCENDIYWIMPYLSYYGGGLLDNNFESIYESPQTISGLNFYKDLVVKHKVAPTKSQIGSSTLAQMFIDGKIAMYLSGRWMYPKISEKADFNWSVITFPAGKGLQPCDCSGWAISKQSRHKDIAKDFVKYLSSEKSSLYFTQTGLIVPARIKTAQNIKNNTHHEKAFLEAIKISEKTNVNKNYKKLIDKINKELEL